MKMLKLLVLILAALVPSIKINAQYISTSENFSYFWFTNYPGYFVPLVPSYTNLTDVSIDSAQFDASTAAYISGKADATTMTTALAGKQASLPIGSGSQYIGGDFGLHSLPSYTSPLPISILVTNGWFLNGGIYNWGGQGTVNIRCFGTLVLGAAAGSCEAQMWVRTNGGPWKVTDYASDQALIGLARSPKFSINSDVPKGWDFTFTNVSVTGVGSSISWNTTNVIRYYNDPNP